MQPAGRHSVVWLLPALAVIATAQHITTPASVFERQAGESVDLPCNVPGLNKSADVVVWMKGDMMLAMDDEVYAMEDPRVAISVNDTSYTLTISSLETFDSGDYECRVSLPEVSVTHTLNVLVPPAVRLHSDQKVIVQAGEDVYVRCSTLGHPRPNITWHRLRDQTSPWWLGRRVVRVSIDDQHAERGLLHIRRAQVADSGVYECLASNGVPPKDSASVVIQVQDEKTDQVGAATVATTSGSESGSADESVETKLHVTKITVHLTRNQKLEFVSDAEYQAFKTRNPEYFD